MAATTSQDYLLNLQPHFKFLPLPAEDGSFRLLELLRSDHHDGPTRLRTSVAHLSRLHKRSFCALSYVWGKPGDRRVIEVDGLPYLVQYNLWAFLQEMRRFDRLKKRFLFVDAICIDQENLEERNAQVRLMGQIYSSAAHVLAWIGEAADGSDKLMRCIDFGRKGIQRSVAKFYGEDEEGPRRYNTACRALLARSYWARVWVIQEVLLAKSVTVLCGRRSLPFESLQYLAQGIFSDPITLGPLINSRMPGYTADLRKDLAGLLTFYLRHRCSDPRDRVYGLLGLVPDVNYESKRRDGRGIEIDYSQNALWLFFRVMAVARFGFDILDRARELRTALEIGDYLPVHPMGKELLEATSMTFEECSESRTFQVQTRNLGGLRELSEKQTAAMHAHRQPSFSPIVCFNPEENVYCWTYSSVQHGDMLYEIDPHPERNRFGFIFRDVQRSTGPDTIRRVCIGVCLTFVAHEEAGSCQLPDTQNLQLVDFTRLSLQNAIPHSGLNHVGTDNFKVKLTWLEMLVLTTDTTTSLKL